MDSELDSLGSYVGFLKESDYVTMLKGHCLVHGCLDCSQHRRGVTILNISRLTPDHADATGILAGSEVPIILRYILYCVIPCMF